MLKKNKENIYCLINVTTLFIKIPTRRRLKLWINKIRGKMANKRITVNTLYKKYFFNNKIKYYLVFEWTLTNKC